MKGVAGFGLLLALLGASSATGAVVVPATSPTSAPLSTSCQCFAVTCGNGSTSAACQATCPGQAVCSCASCSGGSKGSYLTGQNSCFCQ